MPQALNLQTFGSVIVIGAYAGSEAAAAYLAGDPASPEAWYLNVAVFRPFELARADVSPLHHLFGPNALTGALVCLLVALGLRALRWRLGVAAMANVCFACTAALIYTWVDQPGTHRAASLLPVSVMQRPDVALMAVMAGASFLAFAISHLSFLGRIRSQRAPPDADIAG